MRRFIVSLIAGAVMMSADQVATAQVDPDVVQAIIKEGKDNSQVWDKLIYLSEEIGTRLTGSTRGMDANIWAMDTFKGWGLQNVHLQQWGEIPVGFDRGPSYAKMVAPTEYEFEFTTRAWSAGTDGPVRGVVIKAPRDDDEFEQIAEHLAGAWVLAPGIAAGGARRGVLPPGTVPPVSAAMATKLYGAGIAGIITASRNELVVTGGERGWRDMSYDNLPTEVTVTVRRSDYDAINSRLADGEQVEIEIDLPHTFNEGPIPVYNVIADIPGSEFPDQYVIFSGHIDTWDGPGSMGTQDNGTGTTVMMEAARILMEVGVKPRRTIRFILWTGEEQGLHGSQFYVSNLSDDEKAKISAVFVDDGGTNYQGGVTCTHEMEPILAAAFAPVHAAFPDMPIELTVEDRLSRFGGSDHAPFVRAGIPAFFFKESGSGGREGKNYRFIHHTQNDTPRYAVPEYLVQSATCSAVLGYHLAMLDELLPREPSDAELTARQQAAAEADDWVATLGPLTGTWEAHAIESDFEFTFSMLFEHHEDGRIRGWTTARDVIGAMEDIAYVATTGELRFNRSTDGMGVITYEAIVKGDEMTGVMAAGDRFSMKFLARRSQALTSQ